MKNYSWLLTSLCLLPFCANANWYGGVNLGINSVSTEKSLAYPLEGAQVTSSHFHNSWNGFHAQILGGYDFLIGDKAGVALELDGDFFNGKSRYTINNFFFSEGANAEEKFKQGVGLFVLPEYRFHDNVRFFAGPGVSFGRFITRYNNTAGNIGVSRNANKTLTGYGLKAYVATRVTASTDFLVAWQYTQYDSLKYSAVEPLSGSSLSGRYKPNVNLFMVGLRMQIPDYPIGHDK
jgi:opacity protein-like surface antigen